MTAIQQSAIELLRCALAHERGSRLVGNVTAAEIARIAAWHLTTCPACGSEPWVNIDCGVCMAVSSLEPL